MIALAVALLVAAFASSAQAAGGTGSSRLPWQGPGEVLEYRSCGCADSCWIAQLRDARSRVSKASLRCDCEQLHARLGVKGAERVVAPSCPANDSVDKPQAIRKEMERLRGR
jgi:hypothetical protein